MAVQGLPLVLLPALKRKHSKNNARNETGKKKHHTTGICEALIYADDDEGE